MNFCIIVILVLVIFSPFPHRNNFYFNLQVGHIQKRQLSTGKVYEIKTLSLKPPIFGKNSFTQDIIFLFLHSLLFCEIDL